MWSLPGTNFLLHASQSQRQSMPTDETSGRLWLQHGPRQDNYWLNYCLTFNNPIVLSQRVGNSILDLWLTVGKESSLCVWDKSSCGVSQRYGWHSISQLLSIIAKLVKTYICCNYNLPPGVGIGCLWLWLTCSRKLVPGKHHIIFRLFMSLHWWETSYPCLTKPWGNLLW